MTFHKICERCRAEFEAIGINKRFCSAKCSLAQRLSRVVVRLDIACPKCGNIRVLRVKKGSVHSVIQANSLCRNCESDRRTGAGSPSWKGGHSHWLPGRYGKDKDGLSWTTQRRLAWERDGFVCRHCGKRKGRNPSVHHIVPWRDSHSHALDNLICLCQSCHLKEEAATQEKWGGICTESYKISQKIFCKTCGVRIHLYRNHEVCSKCLQLQKTKTEVSRLADIASITQLKRGDINSLAAKCGITYGGVRKFLRKHRSDLASFRKPPIYTSTS